MTTCSKPNRVRFCLLRVRGRAVVLGQRQSTSWCRLQARLLRPLKKPQREAPRARAIPRVLVSLYLQPAAAIWNLRVRFALGLELVAFALDLPDHKLDRLNKDAAAQAALCCLARTNGFHRKHPPFPAGTCHAADFVSNAYTVCPSDCTSAKEAIGPALVEGPCT